MPEGSGPGAVPPARVREAVAESVAARSLRRVAREVGMSPTGLQKFLAGASPYSATRRKLERWYVREAAAGYAAGPGPEAAAAAIRVLAHGLPPGRRRRAALALLDALEASYRDGGGAVPEWLTELRAGVEAEG